jgi:hypothetical protein
MSKQLDDVIAQSKLLHAENSTSKQLDDVIAESNLLHAGVMGMKWGVRRSNKQLARAAVGRKASKKAAKKERKASKKSDSEATGSQKKSAGGKDDVKKNKDKTRFKTSGKKLTNDELSSRISRMETEKRYRDLNKRSVSVGEKMAADVIKSVGKDTSVKVLNGVASFAAKRALDKKFNPDVANAILPKVSSGRQSND